METFHFNFGCEPRKTHLSYKRLGSVNGLPKQPPESRTQMQLPFLSVRRRLLLGKIRDYIFAFPRKAQHSFWVSGNALFAKAIRVDIWGYFTLGQRKKLASLFAKT